MNKSPMTTCGGTSILQEGITETWDVDEAVEASEEVELTQTPMNNSLLVFLNGLLLTEGIVNDYTISELMLNFLHGSIYVGDRITVRYRGS